jgi:hypothetical protein
MTHGWVEIVKIVNRIDDLADLCISKIRYEQWKGHPDRFKFIMMWMLPKIAHDGAMEEPRQNKAVASWVDLYSHSYELKDVRVFELTPDDYFLAEICTKLESLDMRGLRLSEYPEAC